MRKDRQVRVDKETYEIIRRLQGDYIRQRREYITMLDIIRKKFNGEI